MSVKDKKQLMPTLIEVDLLLPYLSEGDFSEGVVVINEDGIERKFSTASSFLNI